MTQIEKAHAWFRANDYAAYMVDTELYVEVWSETLKHSTDVHTSTAEIEYRAELWNQQQNTNQTKI